MQLDKHAVTQNRQASALIPRQSLYAELLDRLRGLIVEGELQPAQKVPERELCQRYGVSRTPMREALKVLAAEGLLVLTPNRGATVAPIGLAEMEELFPIIGALEGLAGELACKSITDAELAAIAATQARMLKAYASGDLKRYFSANQEIHAAILAAARNTKLAQTHRSLAGRVKRARYLANLTGKRWKQAVEEHERIHELLQARQGRRLGRLLRDHLDHKLESVKHALAAGPRPRPAISSRSHAE
ncbi:MAG: GntR family transcriptional regulator [Hyphomicrobiaceae bacterium]|nr:MAG: GntR family transcriptional regulator [Hyphomicrobiaceae bacterium]